MDLFDPKLPFFKGNLHCHTTVSDGKLSPDEVVALYRDLGYDFLALTDHRRLSAPTHLEEMCIRDRPVRVLSAGGRNAPGARRSPVA